MNQALELDIKAGFDPAKQTNLVWQLQERHKDLERQTRTLLNRINKEGLKGIHDSAGIDIWRIEADRNCAIAFEVGEILMLLGEKNPSYGVLAGIIPG